MLEFIVLILHPKKPTRITVTILNTIFDAMSRVKQVNWGTIMQDIVAKLVFG